MPFALCALITQTLVACEPEKEAPPPPCGATQCDLRDTSCQEHVLEVVQCFRGGDAGLPDVDVISEEDYRALAAEQPEPSEEERRRHDRFARGMSLLKLAADPEDAELAEDDDSDAGTEDEVEDAGADAGADAGLLDVAPLIAARYLSDEERIIVVDHDEPTSSSDALAIFAHELVHALQDREHDLDSFYAEGSGTIDQTIARTALVEGEATQYDVLTYAAMQGVSPSSIDWLSIYRGWQLEEVANTYEDDAPLRSMLTRYPAPFGGFYVTNEFLGWGQSRVDELFDAPLSSTLELLLLAPLEDVEAEPAAALRDELLPVPPAGFELVAYDQLGVLGVDVFLHRFDLTEVESVDRAVLYVLADGISVFYDAENARTVTAWRLRFAADKVPDEEMLGDWREALGAPDEDAPEPHDDVRARVFVAEDDLFVIISDAPLDPEWLGEDLTWQAPPDDAFTSTQ